MRKIISWMFPFFIYSIVIFVLIIIPIFIPSGSDILWLFAWGFYFPYVYIGIYIFGFTLGYLVQKRSKTQTIRIQLLLSLISFIITILILNIYTWNSGMKQFILGSLLPSSGSSFLFFIAEIIAKCKQIKK